MAAPAQSQQATANNWWAQDLSPGRFLSHTDGRDGVLAQVTATSHFPEGDVFAIGGLAKVDSVCAARLAASSRRNEISDRIGRSGRLQALSTTERPAVAPVYYASSQSFTKHLVAKVGVTTLVQRFPRIANGTWRYVLESAAGMPLEDLRAEWLTDLGQTTKPRDHGSAPNNTDVFFSSRLIADDTPPLVAR